MGRKAVVTGGAGFVGSHLVEALIEKNFQVVVLDDFSSGKLSNLRRVANHPQLKVVKGDIRDKGTIQHLLKNTDAVFHEAAEVGVGRSVRNPDLTNDVNVNGTLNLLRSAVKNHVGRFINASSAAIYGDQGTVPNYEEMGPQPLSPYAASKLSAENYCQAFHETYRLETVSLRYFNVYGPRQGLGEYSGVISSFLKRTSAGLPPIIYGDGRQTRDFVHVSDVVQANLLAMNDDRAVGNVFNIGSGESVSISSLAKVIIRLSGRRGLHAILKGAKLGDIRHSCADIRKSKRLLDYAPSVSLSEGLQRIVQSN
jgi:UDP-glucose 4-epimerase